MGCAAIVPLADVIDSSNHPERQLRRYSIHSRVQFRGNDGTWHEGVTVNICARGVLFRTSEAMPVSSALDLYIALPHGTAGVTHVRCSGRVVRIEPSLETGDALMAVTIDQFQLRRAGTDPPPQM